MPIDLIGRDTFDDNTKEAVVILKILDTIQGGVTLDTAGFTEDYVQKGHVLIKVNATGVIKPLPVTGGAFVALPADHSYYGICLTTQPVTEPFVGVLIQGAVNYKAMPFTATTILPAMSTALVNINFRSDK